MKARNVMIGVAVGVVGLLVAGLLLGSRAYGWSCLGAGRTALWGAGWPWGMHTLGGGLLMVVFWALALGSAAILLAGLGRHSSRVALQEESSLEILGRRYARGEISRDEFEQARERLSR